MATIVHQTKIQGSLGKRLFIRFSRIFGVQVVDYIAT
jgi:hypothetical protein